MRIHRTLPLLFLALFPTTPAFADDKTHPPAGTSASATTVAATDRARSLHIEGAKLYDEGKYEQAYVAFIAAWALKKHPQIAGNLADCEVKLGKYRDAAEHYRFITRNTSGDVKPEDQRRAEGRLREAQQKIAVVEIGISAAGAEVSLDGMAQGKSPLADALFLEPGRHTIEARLDGYASTTRTIDAAVGSSQAVRLEMKSSSFPVNPPGVPTAPLAARSMAPVVVLGGIAAVGLAAGVAVFVAGNGKLSTAEGLHKGILDAHRSCVPGASNFDARCADVDSVSASADTFHRIGVGAMVGGGAAAIGAVVYLLWPSSTPTTGATVRVLPVATTSGGGLFATGNF
jgi:hypothetical protein